MLASAPVMSIVNPWFAPWINQLPSKMSKFHPQPHPQLPSLMPVNLMQRLGEFLPRIRRRASRIASFTVHQHDKLSVLQNGATLRTPTWSRKSKKPAHSIRRKSPRYSRPALLFSGETFRCDGDDSLWPVWKREHLSGLCSFEWCR